MSLFVVFVEYEYVSRLRKYLINLMKCPHNTIHNNSSTFLYLFGVTQKKGQLYVYLCSHFALRTQCFVFPLSLALERRTKQNDAKTHNTSCVAKVNIHI